MFTLALVLIQESSLPPAPGFPPFTDVGLLIWAILTGLIMGGFISFLLFKLRLWITFVVAAIVAYAAFEQIGASSWCYLSTGDNGYYEGVHSFYWLMSMAVAVAAVGLLRIWRKKQEAREHAAVMPA